MLGIPHLKITCLFTIPTILFTNLLLQFQYLRHQTHSVQFDHPEHPSWDNTFSMLVTKKTQSQFKLL
jgi:hypothetical protein